MLGGGFEEADADIAGLDLRSGRAATGSDHSSSGRHDDGLGLLAVRAVAQRAEPGERVLVRKAPEGIALGHWPPYHHPRATPVNARLPGRSRSRRAILPRCPRRSTTSAAPRRAWTASRTARRSSRRGRSTRSSAPRCTSRPKACSAPAPFKFRGAYNAISTLTDAQRAAGVLAASSGNHAQAVALAARLCDTRATILMPHDAPAGKRAATEAYGATIVGFDRYADDREQLLARARDASAGCTSCTPTTIRASSPAPARPRSSCSRTPATSTCCSCRSAAAGSISGCATVVKALSPATRVVGVEPEASDDVARSKASGRRERVVVGTTIADGQQLPTPGALTWPVIDALVDDVVTVSDEQIVAAMRLLFERLKVVAEPSGASALAALLGRRAARGAQPRRRRPLGGERRRGALRAAARLRLAGSGTAGATSDRRGGGRARGRGRTAR